jgi:hypothetical protein
MLPKGPTSAEYLIALTRCVPIDAVDNPLSRRCIPSFGRQSANPLFTRLKEPMKVARHHRECQQVVSILGEVKHRLHYTLRRSRIFEMPHDWLLV